MSDSEIKRWFEANKEEMITGFVQLGQTFPYYAALVPTRLREMMEYEWLGAYTLLCLDEEEHLKNLSDIRQNINGFEVIPMEERVSFMRARVSVIQAMMDKDPTTVELRAKWQQKLEQAQRYYQSVVGALTAQARVEKMRRRKAGPIKEE